MSKRDIVNLVLAFAMLGLLIGIAINIFARENTPLGDAGMITVIISFLVAAICQIILWITDRRR